MTDSRDLKRRTDRLSQAKHRGSRHSYRTEAENLRILIAWVVGELSEGQVATALGLDRVAARRMMDEAIVAGTDLAEALLRKHRRLNHND